MSLSNCEFCNSPAHNWIDCKKKPDGWKPDRLLKPMAPKTDEDARKVADDLAAFGSAVMVDGSHVPLEQVYVMAPEKPEQTPKRGRGRPASIADMRRYKAEKQRAYRAALKAKGETK